MNKKTMLKLFKDLNFKRVSGTDGEKRAAEYFKTYIASLGLKSAVETFEVKSGKVKSASLKADGKEIPCRGYRGAKSVKELKAPLYYLRANDAYSLSQCKDKIVIFIGYLGKFRYEDLVKNGALGFISTNGNLNEADRDIDDRELRSYVSEGLELLPGVNINIKDAEKLISSKPKEVCLSLQGETTIDTSYNVVTYIEGESKEEIVITAHYDSVPLSVGIYDNLSGSLALLGIMEALMKTRHHYSLRFVLCGSEERGLLGSKAYIENHSDDLETIRLCVNLDMVGTTLGNVIAVCTTEAKLTNYLEYKGFISGYPLSVSQGVYSSDSTPFADKGIPSLSFARIVPNDGLIIHNRYDTLTHMDVDNMFADITFISTFVKEMADAAYLPVKKAIPDDLKERLDEYNGRKRPEPKVS